MDDFNERTLIKLREESLKMADEIERLKAENESLKCASNERYEERKKLLGRLEDAQQETESSREWANSLHNELLIMRGQVTAYKHCIAALTGTEIPLEISGKTPKNIEW